MDARLFALLAAGMLYAGFPSAADFVWFNTETNRVAYEDGFTFITGNRTNPAVAGLVQLIRTPSGTIHPAVNWGDGTTGDNMVVDTSWMGRSVVPPDRDGWLNHMGDDVSDSGNSNYFVRVWTAPSPDWNAGLVPVSLTNFYGDSALWVSPVADPPSPPAQFDFGGVGDGNGVGFSANLKALEDTTDTDGDDLPDWWEFLHFGGNTNAVWYQDVDGDGTINLHEYIAGTDPTNAASFFRIDHAHRDPDDGIVLEWQSVSGRVYHVWASTNLVNGFEPVETNIPATPPINVYTNPASEIDWEFFGLEVELDL